MAKVTECNGCGVIFIHNKYTLKISGTILYYNKLHDTERNGGIDFLSSMYK